MFRHVFFISAILLFIHSCQSPEPKQITLSQDGYKTTYFISSDSLKQGVFKKYYQNDTLWETANYTDSQLTGERRIYADDGQLEIVENYTKDTLNGEYLKLHPDGSKIQMKYVKGILQGKSTSYYPDGQLKEEVNFEANEENGPFVEYHKNGKIAWKGNYRNGDNEVDSLYNYDEMGALIKVLYCDSLSICTTIRTGKSNRIN